MEVDSEKLITILVSGGALISVLAGITAAIIMFQVRKKFGTGVLATGFRSISFGVFFIALGILIDFVESYIQLSTTLPVTTTLLLAKDACFIIGTYVIVIGSKNTGDKLESLTK